jgi:protein-tyrosine phosphatase
VLIALLLHVAGVPEPTIVADYVVSNQYLQPLYDEILAGIADPVRRAVVADRLHCRPETMTGVFAHLRREHGGVEPFLAQAGLGAGELAALRARLVTADER